MSRIAPYPLRMPPELREALEERATKSKRSLQQEVIYHIDMSLQLEKLLASAPPSSDDTYKRIAKALRLENEVKKKDKKIEELKMQVSLLAESTKNSDTDKFRDIETQARFAQEALEKLIKNIPLRYEELGEKLTLARSIFPNKKAK
ncbi:Arc family DNA-binding protein [Xenorhabdus bovienii]|uniref:Putative phage protein n=1 Tax=Xenorhabdus bovienii TaxID=40576 RepID=A0A0B6X4U4_XENBV|nr:Arc family DNA-binding protein [Xenorhabdus bovienii]CDM88166.1 Putative phage protein [Xenorhabdus bovienii]